MRTINKAGALLATIAALALGACASTTPYPSNPNVAGANQVYPVYGVVDSIELVQQGSTGGSNIGLGTVAGAVVGGVLGNQVGSGSGKTAATVIGAAGGGYVGHQMENRQQQRADVYRITVRMDDGSYQSLTQGSKNDFRVGDRVRLDRGVLQRY